MPKVDESAPDLSHLEKRLQSLEDQLTIHRVIMTHPPAADTGDGEFWHLILGEGGRTDYALEPGGRAGLLSGLVTSDQLAAATSQPEHARVRQSGLAHFSSAPIVVVAGDEAEAWNYHQTIVRTEDGFRVLRVFANHWELVRSERGWQVTMRKVRLLDGNEEAIDILRGAVSATSALMSSANGAH
jgi:SnoaL-like domain